MFVSIDEAEDKYENENRNFFALQRSNSRQKWQSILDENNSKILETEMTQVLIEVNRYITKIEIKSSALQNPSNITQVEEKKFKEYLAMGRELITKLKVLVTLEKASAMEKYEQSHVRKLSYAATEDTTSGVDTESVVDGIGGFSREDSFDRRNSQTISLVHKYAASFTSHYEILNKLNHNVEEVIDRFDSCLDYINQQLQTRSGNIIKDKSTNIIMEESLDTSQIIIQQPSLDSLESEHDIQATSMMESQVVVEILKEHLQKSSLVPVYKHVNTSGTGHLIEHTYSCSVAGLYCEGKSRKKSRAKEEAAVGMINQIIKRQKCDSLPMQIIPLASYQISEMTTLLNNREDLIDKLEEHCLQFHEPPPLYTILTDTRKNNEPYYAIKCEAMGYTAVGHGSQKLQAKKNSAKSILNLIATRKRS